MNKFKKAVVTGATSGIGAAIVAELVKSGREVLAIGRRTERLKQIASETNAKVLAVDIRNVEEYVDQILEFAPDILVNNAGVGHGIDSLLSIDRQTIQDAIDTNVTAWINLTTVVIPAMRQQQHGHIVNIGSIAGLHSMVSAIYGATKAAIHMFSQNLRSELAGSGIRITEICPGRTATEFYQVAQGNRDALDKIGQSNIKELQPEDVANSVMYAINAPDYVNVATIEILPTDQIAGGVRMAPLQSAN